MKKKKRKKKVVKDLSMPKMPSGNENYWLQVTKNKEDIICFAERGNERQKKALKAAIEYRNWQIQEGMVEVDFWKKVDIEINFLEIDITKPPKPKQKVLVDGYIEDRITTSEKPKVVVDLFDFSNIEDLTKE